MENEILKKAYQEVDFLLKKCITSNTNSLWDMKNTHSQEYYMAISLLDEYGLINYRLPFDKDRSLIDISTEGLKVIEAGGIESYIWALKNKKEEKENGEMQQLRTNNMLLTKQLADYEIMKGKVTTANRTSIIIAIAAVAGLVLQYLLLKCS